MFFSLLFIEYFENQKEKVNNEKNEKRIAAIGCGRTHGVLAEQLYAR